MCCSQLRSHVTGFPVGKRMCDGCMSVCSMVTWVSYAVSFDMQIVSETPALAEMQLPQRLSAYQYYHIPSHHMYDAQKLLTNGFWFAKSAETFQF